MSRVIGLIIFGSLQKICNFAHGEMAEWSIAAVLKTVDLQGSGGSNPSLSAGIESIKMKTTENKHFSVVFCFYKVQKSLSTISPHSFSHALAFS